MICLGAKNLGLTESHVIGEGDGIFFFLDIIFDIPRLYRKIQLSCRGSAVLAAATTLPTAQRLWTMLTPQEELSTLE